MDLKRAIHSPPDFSAAFVERVARLREAIMGRTGLTLTHDADMNYSAAQKLILWLDESGTGLSDHAFAAYQIDLLVSSKSRVYTLVYWKKNNLGEWFQISNMIDEDGIVDDVIRVQECLEEHNYVFLPRSDLDHVVEGHFTELDGAPATLFQVLFSEMY